MVSPGMRIAFGLCSYPGEQYLIPHLAAFTLKHLADFAPPHIPEKFNLLLHFKYLNTSLNLGPLDQNNGFKSFWKTLENMWKFFPLGDCGRIIWQRWLRWTCIQCTKIGWQGKEFGINLTEGSNKASTQSLIRFPPAAVFFPFNPHY